MAYEPYSSKITSSKKLSDYVDKDSSRPSSSASRAPDQSEKWNNQPSESVANLTQYSRPPTSSRSTSSRLDSAKYDSRPVSVSSSSAAQRANNGGGTSRPSSSMKEESSSVPRVDEPPPVLAKDSSRPPSSANRVSTGVDPERASSRPSSSRAQSLFLDFPGKSSISRPPSSSSPHYATAGGRSRPSSASAASNFFKIDDEPLESSAFDAKNAEPVQRKFSTGYDYLDLNVNADIPHRPVSSSGSAVDVDAGRPRSGQFGSSRANSRQSNAGRHEPSASLEFHTDGELLDLLISSCKHLIKGYEHFSDTEEDSLHMVKQITHSHRSPRNPSHGTYSARALIDACDDEAEEVDMEEDRASVRSSPSLGRGYSNSGKSEVFEDAPKSTPAAPKQPIRFSDWDD